MGLNQDLIKGRSKNVEDFGGAPKNDEIIYGKVGDQDIKITKALGYFASVLW